MRRNRYGKLVLPPPANAEAAINVVTPNGSFVGSYAQYLEAKRQESIARMALFDSYDPMSQELIQQWGIRLLAEATKAGCCGWREQGAWIRRKYGKPLC